jgi:uncharacterized protein (DUF427 family)
VAVENVWDYPRPPAVKRCPRHVRAELAGQVLAASDRALRVLQRSHPPTIYVPRDDAREDLLVSTRQPSTRCEFKGAARYLDALISHRRYRAVSWMYPQPSPGYDALTDHLAFYPGRIDAAWLGDERVLAQDGDFYGGWITAELVGPFKGAPGTLRW